MYSTTGLVYFVTLCIVLQVIFFVEFFMLNCSLIIRPNFCYKMTVGIFSKTCYTMLKVYTSTTPVLLILVSGQAHGSWTQGGWTQGGTGGEWANPPSDNTWANVPPPPPPPDSQVRITYHKYLNLSIILKASTYLKYFKFFC